jgi:hypothetical protein
MMSNTYQYMLRKKFFIPKNESVRDYRRDYKYQVISEQVIDEEVDDDGWSK